MLRTPQPAAVSTPSTPSTPQTFRTFVTGPSNALAYNVALTVARAPGSVYNPLYLSGGPGLGKSHLLQAIGAYLTPRLNGAEVLVLSAEAFAQEFAAHLRQGHMLAFRRRYRRAGALLLDDIALLAGRDAAAEELVHTLDALREAERQIVLADEQEPGAVRGLSDRLRARLEASLVIPLSAPDEATRRAILRQKCRQWGAVRAEREGLPEAALAALAARVHGSVRDLEAALASLSAAAAHGSPATAALATQVAAEINRAARQPRGRARVEAMLQAICDYYGVSRPMLLSTSREMTVAQARQVAMYLLREDAGLTASQIGQELGRDHSTVLHGHARIASALKGGDAIMTVVLDGIRLSVLQGQRDTA
ncbi:MAG TPA: DnaA/Hda family protein [Chloroflexota bacterium]|nr:DnaA/Hda family protein [Chloroflexota bacterium]